MVEVKIMTPQRRFEYSGLSVESPSLIRPILEKAAYSVLIKKNNPTKI